MEDHLALVLMDSEGQILDVSFGFEKLTGFSWREAVGSYGRFLHPCGMEAPAESLGIAMCSLYGISSSIEKAIRIKSGQLVQCMVRFDRLMGVSSSSTMILSTFQVNSAIAGDWANKDRAGSHMIASQLPLPPPSHQHRFRRATNRIAPGHGISSLDLTNGLAMVLLGFVAACTMLQRHP
jgi:hypothetical protein